MADEDSRDSNEGGKAIQGEYKAWKKNTPFLYDLVITHALEWPSLTCQWLPNKETTQDCSKQKLLMGTHTDGAVQNYLMIAEVQLPLEDSELDARQFDDERNEVGGYGSGQGKVNIIQQMNHDGEVNRARHMPQNPFLIATKAVSADVYVFDYSKHPSKPAADGVCRPNLVLKGHHAEGYGLAWSPLNPGHLLSGSDDTQICMWDIQANPAKASTLQAQSIYAAHTDVVDDVAWHCHHADIFGSVGDDKRLILWDVRKPPGSAIMIQAQAHEREVNCIAFNPHNPNILATGSADKTVALHDWRNLSQRLHVLDAHTDEVLQIGWSPKNETILASSSTDRRVNIWDLSRIGAQRSAGEAEDGPPELMFVHAGHTTKVSDFAWSPNDDWVCASVAEDNILQIWQIQSNVYTAGDAEVANNAGAGF
ncbi:hypothetical protein FOA52_011820 [Chlamydomonas sp. UWO 241]|nr:hypothetical protein FOA52_011820 [Chlamydomonas sp. UWO 241]